MMEIFLEHTFPSQNDAGFSLRVAIREDCRRLALFGPSGSGKTLTLHSLAGLFSPQKGRIEVHGEVLYDSERKICVPARKRKLGYLFQDYALFPHMTVRRNIAFGLRQSGKGGKSAEIVDRLLDVFELTNVADRYPGGISGGQKQRTALARALAPGPSMLLLDEPFSALDPLLRSRVREQCGTMLDKLGIPTVIISHDPEDVFTFADNVIVYENGSAGRSVPAASLEDCENHENELLRELARAKRVHDYVKRKERERAALAEAIA